VHRNKFLFNKTNRLIIFPNLFLSRNSTCFGQFLCPSSGVFHCTFGTGVCHASLMRAFKHVQDGLAWKLSSDLHDIYQCRMYSGKLLMNGQRNCPKHVEFLEKIHLEKLVCLLVFLKKWFCKSQCLIWVAERTVHNYETFGHNSLSSSPDMNPGHFKFRKRYIFPKILLPLPSGYKWFDIMQYCT